MERTIGLHPRNGAAPPILRRLFHVCAAGSIPLIAIFASSEVMIPLMASLCGGAIAIEVVLVPVAGLEPQDAQAVPPLLKESEDRRVTGATFVALSSLTCFLVFDLDVAVARPVLSRVWRPGGGVCGKQDARASLGLAVLRQVSCRDAGLSGSGPSRRGSFVGGGAINYHWGFLLG